MSERSHRDVVDALLSIITDGVEGDASARLRLKTVVDDVDSLLRVGHGEVVEHDAVDASMINHLLQLIEVTHLYLDLQV